MADTGILVNGVTEILKKLSSVVANEITLVWDFKDELKNLQTTLKMILAVMEDAEKKQVSTAAVRVWLEELKALAYDAEDILDEYAYEVILCKLKKDKSTIFNKVRSVFSSSTPSFVCSWILAHKVKEINAQFNNIAKLKNGLGLRTLNAGSSSSDMNMNHMMMMNRETYSHVVKDWKIVGRKHDKSNIIKMLFEEENSSNDIASSNKGGGKHVSVIPIVGMGGLGKTTMAQLLYNDKAVERHFDIKVWICVSDPFDVKKLFKNIATSLDKYFKYDDTATLENIVCGVKENLRGKKFLLVLDDVWNENPMDWNKLRSPLLVGAEGSKILVTTRNTEVASIMVDKFLPYPLGILNENDCWSLFKELAFGSVAGAEETPNLVEIGKVMVNRCKGLPLAVIFLGSLMRSKKKEEEWKFIRDTKLWFKSPIGKKSKDEILPILRLSYDYLPSHLKQCFSYCCLFPKDFIIKKELLIRLWMAEGFLIESPEENTMSMEEIGNEYFHNLLCNFFFQDVMKNDDGEVESCKMHDLVHDLARSVVGNNECLIIENSRDIEHISEATRRLSLVNLYGDMLPKFLEALKNAKNLRTVLTVFVIGKTIRFDIGSAFKKNKSLRVLNLSESVIEESTSSIGEFEHLRYLDAKRALFPKGIGRLSFLQTLGYFDVGNKEKNKNASVIQELGGLNLLRGDLFIDNLQNVTSKRDAYRANLKERNNLRGLKLRWDDLGPNYVGMTSDRNKLRGEYSKVNDAAVMKGLQPHPNLRFLKIFGFNGSKFPRWMEDSSCLPNLVSLHLSGGLYEELAGLGALPSLTSLSLEYIEKVECIGNEFYYAAGSSSSAAATTISFPSLKKLTLLYMLSLKEWVVPPSTTTTCCFPLLEEINIRHCPLLTTISPTTTIFSSLKLLNLKGMDGRAAKLMVMNNLNTLTSLSLTDIPNLISFPRQGLTENNNTLLSLEMNSCPNFKGFGGGQQLQLSQVSSTSSSLHSFKLYGCPVLRFFPDISSLTSLRELEIQGCKATKSLQDELTCLSSLECLESVQICNYQTSEEMETNEEVIFEWRKSSF